MMLILTRNPDVIENLCDFSVYLGMLLCIKSHSYNKNNNNNNSNNNNNKLIQCHNVEGVRFS